MNKYLKHHGVLGMKWGVRKWRDGASDGIPSKTEGKVGNIKSRKDGKLSKMSDSEEHIQYQKLVKIAKQKRGKGLAKLSNDEISIINKRQELIAKSKLQKDPLIKRFLKNKIVSSIINTAINKAISSAFNKPPNINTVKKPNVNTVKQQVTKSVAPYAKNIVKNMDPKMKDSSDIIEELENMSKPSKLYQSIKKD